MPNALILDSNPGSHGQTVKSYFDNDKPSGWTSSVYDLSSGSISDGVSQAINNDVDIIIRSETQVWNYKDEWDYAWENDIMVVHSHGSNSNVKLQDPPRLFSAVVVGGEDPAGGLENERSYGCGLELDGLAYDDSSAESWATPTVAALIAHLWEYHQDSGLTKKQELLRARSSLRRLALNNNPEGKWSEERGFGFVYSINHPDSNYQELDSRPEDPLDLRAEEIQDGKFRIKWMPYDQGYSPDTIVEYENGDTIAPTSAQSGSGSICYRVSSGDEPIVGKTEETRSGSTVSSSAESITLSVSPTNPYTQTLSGSREDGTVTVKLDPVDASERYTLQEKSTTSWSNTNVTFGLKNGKLEGNRDVPNKFISYKHRVNIDAPTVQTFYSDVLTTSATEKTDKFIIGRNI